mmetsp:Transcript_32227/g.102503  ORF Transcript_32227/g.102503 Transcript_32227/m.102503 type:complete len:211 (+) Transcript_32227:90-722(+)
MRRRLAVNSPRSHSALRTFLRPLKTTCTTTSSCSMSARPSRSLGVMRKYWRPSAPVVLRMMRRMTRRSLRSSMPWLISSTMRNGDCTHLFRLMRNRIVDTARSPPECTCAESVCRSASLRNLTWMSSFHCFTGESPPGPASPSCTRPSKPRSAMYSWKPSEMFSTAPWMKLKCEACFCISISLFASANWAACSTESWRSASLAVASSHCT